MSERIRREAPNAEHHALIQREGERPFDSRIYEIVYRETVDEDGEVISYTAEGCVFDNDGQLVPLSEVEGLIAVMDPGEKMAEILQPKKHAKRKRLLRYLEYVGKAVEVVAKVR